MVDGQWHIADGNHEDTRESNANRHENNESLKPYAISHMLRSASSVERNASSHIVRCYIDNHNFDDIVFTAYRPLFPYDVLTECMVGSGIMCNGEHIAIWCDAGNFQNPWQDNEEVIIIIEALSSDRPYFAAVDFRLNADDVQDIGHVALHPFPEPASKEGLVSWSMPDYRNVIGYSVFESGKRLNNDIITACSYPSHDCADICIKPVFRGGFETVYSPGRQTYRDQRIPLAYAFTVSPNPCINRISINYALPQRSHVDITIYDASGRQVKTVMSEFKAPGYYDVYWDGKDDVGRSASSGIYFVRCAIDAFQTERKILMLR
jgi:hypothetical protein